MGGGVERGVQMLLTTVGAFGAFSLMTIAVGTDYWLYSRGVCRSKGGGDNDTVHKNEEVMTHSGLWRTCCLEGGDWIRRYAHSSPAKPELSFRKLLRCDSAVSTHPMAFKLIACLKSITA